MKPTFFDESVLEAFSREDFADREPYPWQKFSSILRPDAFDALYADFPSVELFERHDERRQRADGQRPHVRFYLAYEPFQDKRPGIVHKADLPKVWRQFIAEIDTNAAYRRLVFSSLGRDDLMVRFNWHMGFSGSEVSPHLDKTPKVGTHIFYFNPEEYWDTSWGGSTLVLGGRAPDVSNPDFGDFAEVTPVDNVGNSSFFFKNGPDAWHGVEAIDCPDGTYRRLFNVLFEHRPGVRQPRSVVARQVRGKLSQMVGPKARTGAATSGSPTSGARS